jgi:hypothetical protein
MNSFSLLEASSVVERFDVIDHKRWDYGFYNKIEIILIDQSKLFVREYVDEDERRYSYHWQTKDNKMIFRWDNAPHHKDLITFPAHCHDGAKVIPSIITTLEEVLGIVERELLKKET